MSDREDEPTDLFDAVCRLDDIADWLWHAGYVNEADAIRATSHELTGYVRIYLPSGGAAQWREGMNQDLKREVRALIQFYDARGWDWTMAVAFTLDRERTRWRSFGRASVSHCRHCGEFLGHGHECKAALPSGERG